MGAQEDIEDEKFKKFRIVLDKNGNTYYNKYCSRFLMGADSVLEIKNKRRTAEIERMRRL